MGAEASEGGAILDLQARAGNQAVAELLAVPVRSTGAVPVQRDAAEAAPAGDDDASGSPRMSIPELSLDIPITSFQQPGQRRPGADQGGDEAVVTLRAGRADVKLQQAAAQGKALPVVVITLGYMTFTLRGVIISSAHVGGDESTYSLSFTSSEVFRAPSRDDPRNDEREPGE